MSVENKAKINIVVNGIHVVCVESFNNGYLSLFAWGHPELKMYNWRQMEGGLDRILPLI